MHIDLQAKLKDGRIIALLGWFGLSLSVCGIIVSNAFTSIGTGLFLLAWVLKKAILDKSRPSFDNISILLAAYFLWAAVSFFNTANLWVSIGGLLKIIKYLLIFLAASDFIENKPAEKKAVLIFLGVGFVAALDGIFQHIAGFDFFRFHMMDRLDSLYRNTAAFHTPNDFAGYLILTIPIFLGGLLFSKNSVQNKILLAIPLSALLFCLYRTGSRGAWLAFIAGIFLLSFLTKKRRVLVILLLVLFVGLALSPVILERAKGLFNTNDSTTWERLKLWQGAVSMIKAHPVLGHGINTYNINFPKYRPTDYLPDNRYAHNCYLQMAAEIGVVGAGIFLLFLVFGVMRAVQKVRALDDSWLKYSLLGMAAGIVAFLFHSAIDTDLYSMRLGTLFWLSFGLLIAGGRAEKPKSILYVRTDRIGDLLLNTPAIHALKAAFPHCHIAVLAKKESAEALQGNNDVNEVIIYDEGASGGIACAWRLFRLINPKKFDTAIISNPKREFHAAMFLCGIERRIGYARKWGFLLTHRLKDEKYKAESHEVEYNLALVGLIGAPPASAKIIFPIEPKDEQEMQKVIAQAGLKGGAKIAALHPGSSNPLKRWGDKNFAALAEKIAAQAGLTVALVGGEEEKPSAKAILNESSVPIVDLTGRFSLKSFGAFLKRCEFLVSSDSAPVHIAAAVGAPVIAIFAKGVSGCEPKRWGPYSGKSIIIHEDLSALSAQEVFDKAKLLLK